MRALRRAFTLIELLVALVILAILAGIAYVGFGQLQEQSRVRAAAGSISSLAKAVHAESVSSQRPYSALGPTNLAALWTGVDLASTQVLNGYNSPGSGTTYTTGQPSGSTWQYRLQAVTAFGRFGYSPWSAPYTAP